MVVPKSVTLATLESSISFGGYNGETISSYKSAGSLYARTGESIDDTCVCER